MDAFDLYGERYDKWYDEPLGAYIYSLELECLKRVSCALEKPSLEVGVGSGRFAKSMGVDYGVDMSIVLLKKAKLRGVKTVLASAEELPFKEQVFCSLLIVASLCFFKNPTRALDEAHRVLKPEGKLILGLIPKGSPWARFYIEKAKRGHPIYVNARFYSYEEITAILEETGFRVEGVFTTLFGPPEGTRSMANGRIEEGFHKGGSFLCIKAKALNLKLYKT